MLSGIKDNNNTFNSRNLANVEKRYGWSEFKIGDREKKIHETKDNETSRSTVRIERNDDLKRKHSRHPRPRYAQTAR